MAQNPEQTDYGCKVDRVTDEYDLQELDDRVLRLRENDDASLRSLESYINQWMLKRAMVENGMTVLDGAEENYHRLLTDDDVMDTARREARRELEQAGVDVDELEDDFVSYQTVRKHLNECLDTDTSEEYTPDIEDARDNFNALIQRVKNVVSRTINRFRKYDVVQIGEPEVRVSVKLRCGDCGRTHELHSFLDSPRCACADETDQDTEQEADERVETETESSVEEEVEAIAPGAGENMGLGDFSEDN